MTAILELEDMVRVYLRNWEDSDLLPSEAARELLHTVLGFDRLDQARAEFLIAVRQHPKPLT